jgi:hypothetical protein
MKDQRTDGRLPEWTVMFALHDAFRRDLDALAATYTSPAAVRARWAHFRDQMHSVTSPRTRPCGLRRGPGSPATRTA